MKQTALYDWHQAHQGQMVPFAGWNMPLHYGSQLEEHNAVRQQAGIFDVSHMAVVDITGPQSQMFLAKLLANNIHKLKSPGKALYTCMLNESGGVIDDLITYYVADNFYRVVLNAGCTEKDLAWIQKQQAGFEVEITTRNELCMLALQGPEARKLTETVFTPKQSELVHTLSIFSCDEADNMFIARTGYTGEDGIEIMVKASEAESLWHDLVQVGFKPIGLGARDTLRLEAGLNLYGTDMDETVNPYESNLGWTVSISDDRDFIGKAALQQAKKAGVSRQLVGLVLTEKGVLRHDYEILQQGNAVGKITSGSFAPSLQTSIAFARIQTPVLDDYQVTIRKKQLPIKVVKMPFIKNGKATFTV